MTRKLGEAARLIGKVVVPVSRVANSVGVIFLMVMMFFITLDVCLRALFNLPVLGPYTYEAIGFMMVIVVFFGIAHCQVQKSHVSVDLVTSRLPKRAQAAIGSCINFISMGLFGVLTWRSIVQAQFLRDVGVISAILPVPVFPFMLLVAFGSGLLCLILLVNFLDSLTNEAVK
jgi:TRAP-type C4-dicarboxylate transport system permease small subunit